MDILHGRGVTDCAIAILVFIVLKRCLLIFLFNLVLSVLHIFALTFVISIIAFAVVIANLCFSLLITS